MADLDTSASVYPSRTRLFPSARNSFGLVGHVRLGLPSKDCLRSTSEKWICVIRGALPYPSRTHRFPSARNSSGLFGHVRLGLPFQNTSFSLSEKLIWPSWTLPPRPAQPGLLVFHQRKMDLLASGPAACRIRDKTLFLSGTLN